MKKVHIGGHYYACEDGTIWSSYGKGRTLKSGLGTNGRPLVILADAGKNQTKYVHVLICEAFHGPRPGGLVVSHIDGDPSNNRPSNLCWETQADNLARRIAHGTTDRGFQNSRACLTPEDVKNIHLLKRKGLTDQAISDRLGVSRTTVIRVKKGYRYADE